MKYFSSSRLGKEGYRKEKKSLKRNSASGSWEYSNCSGAHSNIGQCLPVTEWHAVDSPVSAVYASSQPIQANIGSQAWLTSVPHIMKPRKEHKRDSTFWCRKDCGMTNRTSVITALLWAPQMGFSFSPNTFSFERWTWCREGNNVSFSQLFHSISPKFSPYSSLWWVCPLFIKVLSIAFLMVKGSTLTIPGWKAVLIQPIAPLMLWFKYLYGSLGKISS